MMRREDWLWLLLKAAGLWLVVTAVEAMSVETWNWFSRDNSPTAGREQFLQVAVPLAAGLVLLLVDFSRWLPVESSEEAPPLEPRLTMHRSDWLWVGLKIVGAWYGMIMIMYANQVVRWSSQSWLDYCGALITPIVGMVLSLWLLFGDSVWRAAAGKSVARPGAQRSASRRRAQRRQVLFVVTVFVLLAVVPVLLLWWVAEGTR